MLISNKYLINSNKELNKFMENLREKVKLHN